jgi:hypothetical protein
MIRAEEMYSLPIRVGSAKLFSFLAFAIQPMKHKLVNHLSDYLNEIMIVKSSCRKTCHLQSRSEKCRHPKFLAAEKDLSQRHGVSPYVASACR